MTGVRGRLLGLLGLTLVLGLIATGLANTAVESADDRSQRLAADAAVKGFEDKLAAFDTASSTRLTAAFKDDVDDYKRLLRVAKSAVRRAPAPPTRGTTPTGRRGSEKYRAAVQERATIVEPYVELAELLQDRAIPASRFIVSGRKVVTLDPAEVLDGQPIFTGDPLRDLVVPAFKKARTRLADAGVPDGAELLATDLQAYLDFVIKQTKAGADRIDEAKPFFFDFGTRPKDLLVRLTGLEAQVAREVALLTVGIASDA
ncbi:hypothetical protein [Aeromicrobium sp.]|uniref:hypothetical protein n=1 Tax=Aeromicrobium sp. TaxID=1871063 RepID=UPI0030BB0B9F